jgi:hypothetical protein
VVISIQARDDKDLCMSLMARPTWSEVPSTILVRFFAVTWLAIIPQLVPAKAAINAVIPKTIRVVSLLSLWEVVPVCWENSFCCIIVLFQNEICSGLGISWAIAQFPQLWFRCRHGSPHTWFFFHDLPTKSYPSSRYKIPWVLLAWAWEVSPGNR